MPTMKNMLTKIDQITEILISGHASTRILLIGHVITFIVKRFSNMYKKIIILFFIDMPEPPKRKQPDTGLDSETEIRTDGQNKPSEPVACIRHMCADAAEARISGQ